MKKKAKELQVGDRLRLRPSGCLGYALDSPAQEVEIVKTRRESNSGGVRVTIWVSGRERPYAYLRGSTILTILESN